MERVFPTAPHHKPRYQHCKVQDLLPILPEIAQHTPSKVLVLLGINDLNAGRSVEEISADYQTFYARVAQLLPDTQVYIQSIIPVNDDWRIDINPKDLEKLNQGLAQIAKDRNYSFIDLTPVMASVTGLLKSSITNDGIHLTQAGYRVWLDILDPLILSPSRP